MLYNLVETFLREHKQTKVSQNVVEFTVNGSTSGLGGDYNTNEREFFSDLIIKITFSFEKFPKL